MTETANSVNTLAAGVPTNGDDLLIGDDANDSIDGGAGNDTIRGLAGNDTLIGGTGSDNISGGDGNDAISGSTNGGTLDDNAPDTLTGGAGNDVFFPGNGDLITDFDTSGDIHDGEWRNNDVVMLGGYYTDENLQIINALRAENGDTPYATPLAWLRGDQRDDGVLNDISVKNGMGFDFSLHLNTGGDESNPGAPVDADKLTWDNTKVICFGAATMIDCSNGPKAAGALQVGDKVRTLDHGFCAIQWIGKQHYSAADLTANPNIRPIRIRAGALGQGLPAAELIVSPQHRILVRSKIAQRMFGTEEILVAAKQLLALDGVDVAEDVDDVTYIHFLFDAHEIVFANGLEAESLYTGPEALATLGRAAREEVFAIFPALRDGEAWPAARQIPAGKQARHLAERHIKNAVPLNS